MIFEINLKDIGKINIGKSFLDLVALSAQQ